MKRYISAFAASLSLAILAPTTVSCEGEKLSDESIFVEAAQEHRI